MSASLAFRSPTTRQLLNRILEEPTLASQIGALPSSALARLIGRIGLEDAGEIVAFASTEQLARIFDEELWKGHAPGEDERFDADRFIVWLEVMLEAGDAFASEKLAELPQDLVTLAFHRHVMVLDFESQMLELGRSEVAATEKALSNRLSEEIDEYLIVSRGQNGWDAILTALLALDRDHHAILMGVLERCCAMCAEHIEDAGGLYDVLTSDEMLEDDMAGEREERRAEVGYVSPSAAAAFLKLARMTDDRDAAERDPITRAWFRDLGKQSHAGPNPKGSEKSTARELLAVLRESGVVEAPARKLLNAGRASNVEPLLIRALRRLAEDTHDAFIQRSEEIAYLVNVLVAGCALEGRRMRPIEATRAAIATTSLGLEMALDTARNDLASAARALREQRADQLFRTAWSAIHREVVIPATRLSSLKPSLDEADEDALRALMAECPTLAGSLDVRKGGLDGPCFVTTVSDLARARAFVAR